MFDKEDSKVIKGIAMIMMLYLHLFGVNEKLNGHYYTSIFLGNNYSIINAVLSLFHVCVPLFLFIAGYGFYLSFNKKRLLKKVITKLYSHLWLVYIIFVPILLLMKYISFNPLEMIMNFTGFYHSYLLAWWFFSLYIELYVFSYFFIKFTYKYKIYSDKLLIIISIFLMLIGYFLKFVLPTTVFESFFIQQIYMFLIKQPIFFCGYLFAKNQWFDKKNSKYILLFLPLYFLEFISIIPESFFLIFLIPSLIYFITILLKKSCFIRKVLIFIGDNSTFMWLSHEAIIYYIFQDIVYYYHYSIICLVLALIIDLPIAYALNKIYLFLKDRKECVTINEKTNI